MEPTCKDGEVLGAERVVGGQQLRVAAVEALAQALCGGRIISAAHDGVHTPVWPV